MRRLLLLLAIPVVLAAGVVLVGSYATPDAEAVPLDRGERVAAAFEEHSEAAASKEGRPAGSAPMPYLLAGEDRLLGGAGVTSLWVTDPAAEGRSRCFYLDVEYTVGGFGGSAACGGVESGDRRVHLSGNLESLVGQVGDWPAEAVRIEAVDSYGRLTARVPVVGGYFLFPTALTPHAGTGSQFRLELLGPADRPLATATLPAEPGSALAVAVPRTDG
nr:hypothetical protein [Micromonospora sp. DSM 115978]